MSWLFCHFRFCVGSMQRAGMRSVFSISWYVNAPSAAGLHPHQNPWIQWKRQYSSPEKGRQKLDYKSNIPVGLESIFSQTLALLCLFCVHSRSPLVSIKKGKIFQAEDRQRSFKIKEGRETDEGEQAGWFPIWSWPSEKNNPVLMY